MVRLSRPDETRSAVSSGHHDMDRIPCVWPRSVPSGIVVEDRRSQSRITASSVAVARCRPSEGFQQTSDTGDAPSRSSHHGFFCRRSQTTTAPDTDAVARMCDTCEFQATHVTSAVCLDALGGGAGTKTVGSSGRSSAMT